MSADDRERPVGATSPSASRLGPLAEFLGTEAAGGLLLLLATVAALVWANSPWRDGYTHATICVTGSTTR
jgi:Na+/H+ antiporter NhaA